MTDVTSEMVETAEKRVRAMFGDDQIAIDFCMADWPEGAEHWTWLAEVPEDEIRDWVVATCGRHAEY